MLIKLTPGSPVPIFQQILEEIRSQIANGTLVPGEKLPSGRALASSLQVNMHTVLRAYAELRESGWVEMRRGRGVRVIGPQKPTQELDQAALRLIELATQARMELDELLSLVSHHYQSNQNE